MLIATMRLTVALIVMSAASTWAGQIRECDFGLINPSVPDRVDGIERCAEKLADRLELVGALLAELCQEVRLIEIEGGRPEANGKEVIEKVRSERPHDYLKVCASVLPKRLENEDVAPVRRAEELSDDELAAIISGQRP